MRLLAAGVAALLTIGGVASSLQIAPGPSLRRGLYDAAPNHLWNRIHEVFHVRVAPDGFEYGFDTVDPLLWRETRHLLTGPSHARAVRVLDEFLASNGERQMPGDALDTFVEGRLDLILSRLRGYLDDIPFEVIDTRAQTTGAV